MNPLLRCVSRPRRPSARVPIILQMEATECGAACLAMVLAHFGRWIPLERLREACGVSRDGVQASRLVQVAADHGLVAEGYAPAAHELATLGFPQILFWHFSHFVVLTGFDRKGRVWINDPARGRLRLPPEALREAYSGISLRMQPGPDFVPEGRPPSTVAAVLDRLRPELPLLKALCVASLLLAAPGVLLPSFTRLFIDEVLVRGLSDWLTPLVLGVIGTGLFAALLTRAQQRLLLRLESRLAVGEALRLIWHALSLPMAFYAQRSAAEVAGRLSLTDALAAASSGPLGRAVVGLISALIFLLVMAVIDAGLAATILGLGLVQYELVRRVAQRLAVDSRRVAQRRGEFESTALATLGMLPTWRAGGLEALALSRWNRAAVAATDAEAQLALRGLWIHLLPGSFGLLAAISVLGLGALRVIDGAMTLGTLVAFQALAALFMSPLAEIARSLGTVQQVSGSLARIDDVHRYPAPPLEAGSESYDQTQMLQVGPARLSVQGLAYRYGAHATPVLQDIGFELPRGAWLAVMGRSGSGKSTLGLLIARLLDGHEGRVLLDDTEIGRVAPAAFRASVAYVEQSPRLFEGSIRDNLTLWDDAVSDAQIHRAAQLAQIHADVLARPGDYDSRIGPRGASLSGGQAQRLAIARALLRGPRLLILDEATSALDAVTERALCMALKQLPMTVLFITHRQAPLAWCDHLIVLDRGRITSRRRRSASGARP